MMEANNAKLKTKNVKRQLKIKSFKFLVVVFNFALLVLISPAGASAVTSSDLINDAPLYDGKLVTYEGEVIGDIMEGWVNVGDQSGAIGVFFDSKDMLSKIKIKGNYRFTGDRVKVTGIFHQSCRAHGGDLDIHGQKLEIIKEGRNIYRPLDRTKITSILILTFTLFVLLLIKFIADRGAAG